MNQLQPSQPYRSPNGNLNTNPQSPDQQNQTTFNKETTPWWKEGWFTALLLLIFWPLGLIWMWKYTRWSNIARILITIIFILSILPLLSLLGLYYGLGAFGFLQNSYNNLPFVQHENIYLIKPVSNDWALVDKIKDNVIFEAPAQWPHSALYQKDITFSDDPKDTNASKYLIAFQTEEYENEVKAKMMFEQSRTGFTTTSKDITNSNGYKGIQVDFKDGAVFDRIIYIQVGSNIYRFNYTPAITDKQYSQEQKAQHRTILDHMVNTFRKD